MPLLDLCSDETCEPNETGTVEESETEQCRQKKEANQKRTEKARQTALMNRLKRKAGDLHDMRVEGDEKSDSWAKRIQEMYFTPKFSAIAPLNKDNPFGKPQTQRIGIERERAVMSFLVQLLLLLQKLLTPPRGEKVEQVLDCVILDDTSTRTQDKDSMRSIHSVTNTVQTLHVMYSDSSCECTMLPTPFLSLPSQKTEDVYGAYSAHLIVSNGSIGHRIQALENAVPNIGAKLQDLLDQVGWKLHVFVGDAAKTNSAIFKIQKRHQLAVGAKRKLSIQIKCLLHQICLVRRPSILAIDAYWSTVVRLAHLFENWSFKRQFGISLLHILRQPGRFQRVLALVFERRKVELRKRVLERSIGSEGFHSGTKGFKVNSEVQAPNSRLTTWQVDLSCELQTSY